MKNGPTTNDSSNNNNNTNGTSNSNDNSIITITATIINHYKKNGRKLKRCLQSVFKMSSLFLRPRLWQFES